MTLGQDNILHVNEEVVEADHVHDLHDEDDDEEEEGNEK